MRKVFIFLFLILFISFSWTDSWYIREGAAGADDGSDWTDAWTDIPATLTRGDVYYFADGDYATAGYTFDDAESGTDTITFQKATASAHGTETGWDNAYGDGVATIGNAATTNCLIIDRGYFILDGAVGGGPSSWESGFGFNLTTGNTENIRVIRIANSNTVSNVTIKHAELDGPDVAGVSTGIYSVANATSDITIEYCWIHGHGEGLVRWHDCTDVIIQYSALTTNPSAEPAHHGSGATFWGTTIRVSVRWNRFRTVRGTGWLGVYTGTHTDHAYYGNIFYSDGTHDTATNGVIYNADSGTCTTNDWVVYNNSFFYIDGLPLVARYTVLGSGNICQNNLAYHCDPTESNYFGFDTESHNTDIASTGDDPFVNSAGADFHLSGATDVGTDLDSPYDVDIDGETRGAVGGWDRGAYDYIEGGSPPEAPFATDLVMVLAQLLMIPAISFLIHIFGIGWLYGIIRIFNRIV